MTKTIVMYNSVLIRRIERKPYLYLMVKVLSLFLLSFLAVQTLPSVSFHFPEKMGTTFPHIFLAYFLVAELISAIGRFTYNLVILPKHLTLYPASKSTLFLTIVLADMGDIKSLVYFIPVFIYLSNFVFTDVFVFAYTLILFVLFYLLLEVSLVLIYLLFVKYFDRYKTNLSIIYSAMIIMFVFLGSDHLGFISNIPVIGWVGIGVGYMTRGMVISSVMYAGDLFILLVMELLLGFVLVHKTQLVH